MREYKFRGKRIDDGEWIYGYYFCDEDLDTHYIQGSDYYQNEESNQREAFFIEVDGETIGQYTGIGDKKCKEVCEGDIVDIIALNNDHFQRGAKSRLKVSYWKGNVCLCFNGCETGTPIYVICDSHEIEVVGNIYDNKDLLEDYGQIKE